MMNSQTLFNNYIIAGVEASLVRVRAAEYVVPEADRQQAWQILSFALKVEEAWPVTRELLLELAPQMDMVGLREQWFPYLERGLIQSQKLQDRRTEAELSLEIGYLFQRMDRLDKAEQWLQIANQQFVNLTLLNRQALATGRLANLAYQLNDYQRVETLLNSVMSLGEDDAVIAYLHLIYGHLHSEKTNYEMAEKHYSKAMDLWDAKNDRRRAAVAMQNLGRVFMNKGEYKIAISYYDKATMTFNSVGDRVNLATVYCNMGITYSFLGNSDRALQYFEKVRLEFKTSQSKSNLALVYSSEGIEHLRLENWEKAIEAFAQSSRVWSEIGNDLELANALAGKGIALAELRYFRAANETFQHALELLGQVETSQRKTQIFDEIMKYLLRLNDGRLPIEE